MTNQKRQILWLFLPWALSSSQRKKKLAFFFKWEKEHMYNWLLGQMQQDNNYLCIMKFFILDF